jgi:diketogulonate reductase-like aldo/keto reductase
MTTRRQLLRAIGGAALLATARVDAQRTELLQRPIPATGELLPAVGLGTWITFNVGNDRALRDQSIAVMRAFFDGGGRLIDSSPMYGSAQNVVGEGLARLGRASAVFAAEKVWIGAGARGPAQIEASRRAWNVQRFDLLQVHNLLAWQDHLPTLTAMKKGGSLRYVGITTSEGRRHREFEQIMREHPLDFVQVTYNVLDREAEARLLPLAQERRIAVIVNRPFQQGSLTRALAHQPLPGWAADIDCRSWAQVILKFIVAHPAVTCVIPATTNPAHAAQNMEAARGALPDVALRRRIIADIEKFA